MIVTIPPRARKTASYTALLFSNSTSRSTGEKSTGKWKMENHVWRSEIAMGMNAMEEPVETFKLSCCSACKPRFDS